MAGSSALLKISFYSSSQLAIEKISEVIKTHGGECIIKAAVHLAALLVKCALIENASVHFSGTPSPGLSPSGMTRCWSR